MPFRDKLPEPRWGRVRGCWVVMSQCQAGRRAQQADTGAGVTSYPWVGASLHAVTRHWIQPSGGGVGESVPLSADVLGTISVH